MRKTVVFILCQIQRNFVSGVFDENMMENINEIHFIINMDDGKTFGFHGDEECKYIDTVFGEEWITIVICIIEDPTSDDDFLEQSAIVSYSWHAWLIRS